MRIARSCAVWGMLLMAASADAQGFPNVTRTAGELLAGPVDPAMGRAGIVAWHGERIIVVPEQPGSQNGADFEMRIVDINDPANPQVTHLQARATGVHAHGYFQSGSYLFVGGHCANADASVECAGLPGESFANSFRIGGAGVGLGGSQLKRATMEEEIGLYIGSYHRMATQAPWGANDYWTYSPLPPTSFLSIRRGQLDPVYINDQPTGPGVRQVWNHLDQTGGVTGFAFLIGNILIYASDQSCTGVATYDVSDLDSPPVLLDVLKDENPGGYWPEIYGHYIFFPRRDPGEEGLGGSLNNHAGFMVVDFSDPTDLRVVADRDLPGSNMYVSFQDEYAFMNNYKIDMRTFEVELTLATNNVTLDASQFALPVGNLVVTGGYGATGPGIAVWAHQSAPDTRGPFVAYHLPRPDQTNYSLECPVTLSIPETLRTETIVNGTTLILREAGGANVPIFHSFSSGKLLTVTSQQPLHPDTTYELELTSGILDAAGNGMEPYSFRFSTGNNLGGGNHPPVVSAVNVEPETGTPGVPVTISWTGSDPDPGTPEFRVDFGDGSPRSAWSASLSANHAYASAGHYNVLVQARDAQGAIGASSRGLSVVMPPASPGSTASSTMALDSAASRVFVVNPDSDTVSAVNAATLAKVWEAPTAARPGSIARAGDGTLWVACRDADAIDVLNETTGALVQRIALAYGTRPVAITALPGGASLLVSTEGPGRLLRYSTATRMETGSLALGPMPRAIAVTANGARALVTRFISGEHSGQVYDVDLGGSMTLTRTINLRRDRGPDGSASSRGVPNYLAQVQIAPDGDYAWVVGKKDNTTRGTFFSASPSQALGQDNTVRAQLMLIDLSANVEDVARRFDIDNSDSPAAIAFSPMGDYAFVALQGNAQLAVIDMYDLMTPGSPGTVLARWQTGLAPQGIVADAATGRVFVNDFMGRTVTMFDAQPFFVNGAGQVASSSVSVVAEERLHEAVVQGKRIFYNASDPRMSAEGYISCATCHVDGGHDGRTFDFTSRGEGFRNTTDLRGRSGTFHGAVHWSANFDEIQDFENDIRNEFGGAGFLASDAGFASVSNPLGAPKAGLSEDLDALAAYVTSLGSGTLPRSPQRQANGAMSEAAVRGQVVFNTNNCATCHVPTTDFTDRQAHNVGTLQASSGQRLGATLTGIDTPTLLGVHATAPYFHNGNAETLEEVFTTAGGRLSQAEDGALGGNAVAEERPWLVLKDWHQRRMTTFEGAGTISFSDVASTIAGAGYVEMRYSVSNALAITVTVNGVGTGGMLLPTGNVPSWEPTEWRRLRVPVQWSAGTNTVVINAGGGSIDDVLFVTAGDLVAANAHVRGFSAGDLSDLTAYLRSLDGGNAAVPGASIARDTTPISNGGNDAIVVPTGSAEHAVVYTIANNGNGPLNVGQLYLEATPPGSMWIQNHPDSTVLPNDVTELEIRVLESAMPASGVVHGWTDGTTTNSLQWTINATAQPAGIKDAWFLY